MNFFPHATVSKGAMYVRKLTAFLRKRCRGGSVEQKGIMIFMALADWTGGHLF